MATTIEKIKKLLNLAGNNPEKAEAEAAMLKAQQLMAEAGISISDVSTETEETKTVLHGDISAEKNIPKWQKIIVPVIAQNFRCEALMSRRSIIKDGNIKFVWVWELVGMEGDVEICKSVMDFTFNYFWKQWKKFYRTWKNDPANNGKHSVHGRGAAPRLRIDYARTFAEGLRHMFSDQCTERGLVVTRDPAVDKELATMGIRQVKLKTRSMGDGAAARAGFNDGKMAKKDHYVA